MRAALRSVLLVKYAQEAGVLFSRMTTQPDAARKRLISNLILALKFAGIWTKLDVLYILAAADAQAAKLNWKGDASYDLTAVNSPTFTADLGFAGDGGTSYLDTAWDPATNGSQYTQNSASIGLYCRTSAQAAGNLMGTRTAASVTLLPRNTSDAATYRVNESGAVGTGAGTVTSGVGLFCTSRSGASTTAIYKNGASLYTGSGASTALSSVDVSIGAGNSTFSAGQVSAAMLGANLSSTEHAALYTALNTYLTAVGAA